MKKKTILRILEERFSKLPAKELYARVMCGEVFVDGERVRDPKREFSDECEIVIKTEHRFVSRGGDKLDGVFDSMGIDCADKVIIDCGASTGGFTDCLLKRGARKVYAVDVAYSQLAYSLRQDSRVSVIERQNIAALQAKQFQEIPDAAVVDLSFRSLRRAVAHILSLVKENWALALVKPQFEWQNPPASFDGIVREPEDRRIILETLMRDLLEEKVYMIKALPSPLRGKKGNTEYFFLLTGNEHEGFKEWPAISDGLFKS